VNPKPVRKTRIATRKVTDQKSSEKEDFSTSVTVLQITFSGSIFYTFLADLKSA
jgi:hypothetical protein